MNLLDQTHLSPGINPVEAAARLCGSPGFAFLDTSLEQGAGTSILASRPVEILTSWDALAEALLKYGTHLDLGVPRGAAIGYVTYGGQPRFGIYPDLAVYDHASGRWDDPGRLLAGLPPEEPVLQPPHLATDMSRDVPREDFVASVRRAQEYIAAGDIYQVNLSHRLRARFEGDPFALYLALREISPAPYAAYLNLGGSQILSSSPELFLSMNGRRVRTRPIKGTRPRYRDAGLDERAATELMTSRKEIAELVMITDLERNDLGRVCEYGSVRVPELLRLEPFAQVYHLVSTVDGWLRPGISHLETLRACFPGGSITGAPKKRAMEIIAELERGERGIYTGAIGYFGFNGESCFNIAIRTAVVEAGEVSYRAGAGIVADSIPEAEDDETMHKAAGILAAVSRFQ